MGISLLEIGMPSHAANASVHSLASPSKSMISRDAALPMAGCRSVAVEQIKDFHTAAENGDAEIRRVAFSSEHSMTFTLFSTLAKPRNAALTMQVNAKL